MDLTKHTVSELIEYATKYLENKKKLREYVNRYRRSEKGKKAVRRSAMNYYNKHRRVKKVKKKIETNDN